MSLTEQGVGELIALKKRLGSAELAADRVHVGPEGRCIESALLLGYSTEQLRPDPRLGAQNWGNFDFREAKSYLQRITTWPPGLDTILPGGESARAVWERCASFTRSVDVISTDCLIVTHGVVIRFILATLLSWTETKVASERSVRTGSAVVLNFNGEVALATRITSI